MHPRVACNGENSAVLNWRAVLREVDVDALHLRVLPKTVFAQLAISKD